MVRIQKRLREIMIIENQGERHNELVSLAKIVGASILQYKGGANGYGPSDETELVARILEIQRTKCIAITSFVSVISAITAMISAIAAWFAVVFK